MLNKTLNGLIIHVYFVTRFAPTLILSRIRHFREPMRGSLFRIIMREFTQ